MGVQVCYTICVHDKNCHLLTLKYSICKKMHTKISALTNIDYGCPLMVCNFLNDEIVSELAMGSCD